MFCREHVAQLRDIDQEVRERGAAITVVGNGNPRQAAAFRDEFALPFTLLTDPKLRAFRAAGLRRNLGATFSLGTAKAGLRALRDGHRQGMVQGDPWQQGGTFVITAGGRVAYEHRSDSGGDYAPNGAVLAALADAND